MVILLCEIQPIVTGIPHAKGILLVSLNVGIQTNLKITVVNSKAPSTRVWKLYRKISVSGRIVSPRAHVIF